MRIKNSMKNIYINILTQIVITLLGFFSRKVFLDSLGIEYLGINGLLTNILSMLGLVEGGIGASIVYNLYKPLANNDKPKIIALVQLYKKIYSILAIGIFILGLSLYPFLGILMNEGGNIPFISIIYIIFLIKNIISYLNAHKWSLINADQRGYILAKYNLLFNVITTISKVIILITTKNYILYLLIEAAIFIIQNIYNGKVVEKRYPYIKTKDKYIVEKEVKDNLIMNVKALFLHNIGGYCVFGTDNILISALINVKTVGLYSNYTMIISQVSSLLTPIINGIGASVGNLIATESKEKNYEIFKVANFISFWIYSFCSIALYNLINPFIIWFFGEGLLLDRLTLLIVLINFYITGMRNVINIFKSKAGIFSQDKYVPIIESVINLGSSLILVKYLGLAGIFIGTTISSITIPLWIQSKLVYNNVFNKSVLEYFKKYVIYIIMTVIASIITNRICYIFEINNNFTSLIFKGITCFIIPNMLFLLVFFKTSEFQYLWNVFIPKITKVKVKLSR
ncbi:MAG: hypothetical protein U0N85_06890 [Clostridium sp.]|uniref:lipopolysaccharide biosynthesis protein n=1 Tax=Clostridium sp. TaxID=1506 RepID=UPI002F9480C3